MKKVYCILLSFLLFPTSLGSEDKGLVVSGRVICKDGSAVPNAFIVVNPPGPVGELSYFVKADTEGYFRYKGSYHGPYEVLYVTSPLPQNVYIPLIPPFNEVADGFYFGGRKIRVKAGEELRLGDVPLQVRYRTFSLRLQNQLGEPLITSAEGWQVVWIRVKTASERRVAESGLSINDRQNAVNVKESFITIALPEGVWIIEVAPKGPDVDWYSSGRVKVSEAEPLNVIVKAKSE